MGEDKRIDRDSKSGSLSTPSNQQLSVKTLGQIALVQSMVLHLPDKKSVLSFVKRGLEIVPGIDKVDYRIFDQEIAEDKYKAKCRATPGCFPLEFGGIIYGELLLGISDQVLFEPYIPFVQNLSHMLGVIFEERRQRHLNEAYKNDLEQRVFERTRQLEKEVSEHRRSQKLLDSIINNTQNVIYVKDLEGRYTLVNQQFCEIFKRSYDRIIGCLPTDIFPEEIALEHLSNDREVIRKKESLTFNEQAELEDGRHDYISIKFPIFNDSGEVSAVGGISTDITPLKQVENALRLDEARLEALLKLSQMSDADIKEICDYGLLEAIRLTKSAVGYLAFTAADESVLEMHCLAAQANAPQAAGEKYHAAAMELCNEVIRKRKPWIVNSRSLPAELKPEQTVDAGDPACHMSVPLFEGDHIVMVVGVANNLQDYDEADVRQLRLLMQGMWRLVQRKKADDEKKELEKRLRQAYKMESIGTLAGGIAHDFNNILFAIFGYTELCLSEIELGTFVHDNLKNVLSAAERARDLVAHILTFSRQNESEPIPVQLTPILKEVIKFIRASLPSSIEIRSKISGDPHVVADPTQIHQIMMNLCTNAKQAMSDKGGLLEVTLETVELDPHFAAGHPGLQTGHHIKLTVSDTGCGIPPEIIDRIFDPFFTTKERGEGTGMGLAVVHGIVKNHHGAVTVYSNPGKGSVFNVFLPAIEQRTAQNSITSKIPIGGTENILFVDDENALVELGKIMLKMLGYNITGITSSIEALECFKKDPAQFDLVITDLTMPKMTGDRLAEEMMKLRPDIPIILCTGFSASLTEETAVSMGIRAFVKKPLLIHQISETIRKVLDA